MHITLALPVSSAVCERGFSAQKRIKTDVRGSLHVDTVEDLIRISMEGPSLEDFDAREAVQMWSSQGKRSRRPNYKGWPTDAPCTPQGDLMQCIKTKLCAWTHHLILRIFNIVTGFDHWKCAHISETL